MIPKVSVIVPVYRAEDTIGRCLTALQEQTLSDLELIFVDDCGGDGSLACLRDAAAKDPRIRILQNPVNSGPGTSRNAGIEAANGEYLSFVDADDYPAPDFLELLYKKAKEDDLDLVKGSCVRVKENGETVAYTPVLNEMMRKGLQKGEPLALHFSDEFWSTLYKRETVMERGARFGSTLRGEDRTFLLQLLRRPVRFDFEDGAAYYYVRSSGSLMSAYTPKILEEHIKYLEEQLPYIEREYKDDKCLLFLLYQRFRYNLTLQWEFRRRAEYPAETEEFLCRLRKLLLSLSHAEALKEKYIVLRALGDYGENISPAAFRNPWEEENMDRKREVLKHWADFLARYPDIDEVYAEGFHRQLVKKGDKISVIIPAYNAEKYIEACVKSILKQTYPNLQVIVVNDDSTDKTSAICHRLAKKDDRLLVVDSPKNNGISDTRNIGISYAEGEYIAFVDSDDTVDPRYVEILYRNLLAFDADVSVCASFDVYPGDPITRDEGGTIRIFRRPLDLLKEVRWLYAVVVWNKLYHASIFRDLAFERRRVHQDEMIVHHVLGKAKKLVYTDQKLYYYLYQDKSIMHTQTGSMYFDGYLALMNRLRYLEEREEYELRDLWARRLQDYYTSHLPRIKATGDAELFLLVLYQRMRMLARKNPGCRRTPAAQRLNLFERDPSYRAYLSHPQDPDQSGSQ